VGVRGKVSERLRLGANAEYFHSDNEYKQGIVGPTANPVVPPPDVTNKLFRLKLTGQYAVHKSADVGLTLIHERWKTDDWAWLMFPPSGPTPFVYGTTTDGTTVLPNPKQNSTFIGVRYIYRFQ
jgi:hypothetical protein